MIRTTLYIIIILFSSSCNKELEIDLPEPEAKLVVNSLLNPDSLFKIHVSKTTSVFDSIPLYVSDAEVKLFENNLFIEDLTYSDNGFFISEILKPLESKIYSVEIATEEFGLTSAKDTIPEKIFNLNCSTSDFIGTDIYSGKYAELTINFSDNISKNNFYELFIFQEYSREYIDEPDTVSYLTPWFSNEIAITEENTDAQNKTYGEPILFTDKYFNEENITLHINYYPGAGSINGEPYFPEYYKLLVVIHSVSKQYFDFKQKLRLYEDSQGEFWNVGEAVYIKGNIQNGLGVFAAYTTTIDTLTWDY